MKDKSWGTCLNSWYIKVISSPVVLGENTHTWLLGCLQKLRCQLLTQVLSALDAPCSSFSHEENRVNVFVCAQYVPSVHVKEIQASAIKVLNSKSREKIEKIL